MDEKPVVEVVKPARGGGAKRDRTKSKNKAQKELGPPTYVPPRLDDGCELMRKDDRSAEF